MQDTPKRPAQGHLLRPSKPKRARVEALPSPTTAGREGGEPRVRFTLPPPGPSKQPTAAAPETTREAPYRHATACVCVLHGSSPRLRPALRPRRPQHAALCCDSCALAPRPAPRAANLPVGRRCCSQEGGEQGAHREVERAARRQLARWDAPSGPFAMRPAGWTGRGPWGARYRVLGTRFGFGGAQPVRRADSLGAWGWMRMRIDGHRAQAFSAERCELRLINAIFRAHTPQA